MSKTQKVIVTLHDPFGIVVMRQEVLADFTSAALIGRSIHDAQLALSPNQALQWTVRVEVL